MKCREINKLAHGPRRNSTGPGFASETGWLQNPCYTGFCTLYLGPSQVSTHSPGSPHFPFPVTMGDTSALLRGPFVTRQHFSGPKSLDQRISLHVERGPLSLQSSKGLVVATLAEVWGRFLAGWREQWTLCWNDRTVSVIWRVIKSHKPETSEHLVSVWVAACSCLYLSSAHVRG